MPVEIYRKVPMSRPYILSVTFAITTLMLLCAASLAQAGPPFALFLHAQEPTIKSNSEVNVVVTLENISSREIGILKSTPEFDYSVDVRDEAGKIVPDTDYGRKLKTPGTVEISASAIIVPLKPNEVIEDRLCVSKLYEMHTPGKYLIKMSRTIPEDIGKGVVNSNSITVTVVP